MPNHKLKEVQKSKKVKIITITILIVLIIVIATITIIKKENEKTNQEILQNIQEVIPDKLLPENYSINADKEYKISKDQVKYSLLKDTLKKENNSTYQVKVQYPKEVKKLPKENNSTQSEISIGEDIFTIEISPKTKQIQKIILENKEIIYKK